jgi:methanogenic corrinoid protein MtbC1
MTVELERMLTASLADLEEQLTLTLVQEALDEGMSPLAVVQACERGMREVGERYESHDYYLSGLIMAGEIFREVMALAQPSLEDELAGSATGTVLLGTVRGDIHNIGKNVVRVALRSFGFTVDDLGVDVPPEVFVERLSTTHPDIVGLSGLVSASFQSMRDTVEQVRTQAERDGWHIPVIIGGGIINEEVCRYVGADFWTTDALEGVRICQRLTSPRTP